MPERSTVLHVISVQAKEALPFPPPCVESGEYDDSGLQVLVIRAIGPRRTVVSAPEVLQ